MRLSTQILFAFSIVLILSIIDTLSNYLLSIKVQKNIEFVSNSQDIIRNSTNLHKEMIQMQSSFRGYLLTDDSIFLSNYNIGLTTIPQLLKDQEELVRNNSEQIVLLDSIKSMHQQWVGYANALIEARKKMPSGNATVDPYTFLFENKLKKRIGEKINTIVAEKFAKFDQIEYRVRGVHSSNLINSINRTHVYSLTFFALTIIIGIATTAYIMSLISKRIKTMVLLAENISQGKFETIEDKRKDEMSSLSNSLNIMSANLSKNITELEKKNVELDKFAYVVSHDLKAPIRGIHNVVKWIEEDMGSELSPELNKYLEIIRQRTTRMEELIKGLLDYARTREKSVAEENDVFILVEQIIETIVPRNFTVHLDRLPVITTERLKLEQVFTNLISNAVKYAKNDNGEIWITCKELPFHYEFSVKDNGVGIEPEYHARIFEMFQTLRERDEKESTGVGLAIIKKILDDKHCTITVKSSRGQGAEFIFTWPKKDN